MKKLLFIIPLFLIGCTSPDTPAQTIYLLESNYSAALQIEITYDDLPRCGPPANPPLCSTMNTIKKVRIADDIAYSALKNAEIAVRAHGFSVNNTTAALASATAMTQAFTDITATLEVK